MCNFLVKYLCCCFNYFGQNGSSDDDRSHKNHRKIDKNLANENTDSERYLKSSTETDFDKFKSGTTGDKKFRNLPKIEIRFVSPKGAKDNSLAAHRIRLLERGFDLQSEKPIGKGPFSQVYPVIRVSDQHLMACKIWLNKEMAESSRLSREFCEEVLYVNTDPISSHLVRYYSEFIYDSKFNFIVMELSNGETLHNRLARSPQPFTEAEAKSFFVPIARALNYLHTHRIAHRNLKLDNVLIFRSQNDDNEILKVSDYCTNRIASKADKIVVYVRDAKSVTYMSPQILKFYAKHLHKKYKKYERKIKTIRCIQR